MRTTLFFVLTALFVMSFFLSNASAQEARPMVRLIYFVPEDRRPQPDMKAKLDVLIKDVQRFFADEMERHGFGRKTFQFETDARGKARVHRVNGRFRDRHYHQNTWDKVSSEIRERFDLPHSIHLIAIESEILEGGSACGVGGFHWDGAGDAFIRASGDCFDGVYGRSVAAHELGHAVGLQHDFRDNTYLMSYGANSNRLSHCAAEWLDAHRAFNSRQTAFNEPTTIEMLSPSLVSPPNAIRLRFEIIDSDGLHQAQVFKEDTVFAPGFLELINCKRLNGIRRTVEFVTTELTPKSKEVTLQVIDVQGNFTRESFPIDIAPLLPPPKVVSIPDANLAAAVREALGLRRTEAVTDLAMRELRLLEASNRQITNLTGLEHATNLTELQLGGEWSDSKGFVNSNAISDFSPLFSLSKLKILNLAGAAISNVSTLAGLTQLRVLYLRLSSIKDISALGQLIQLTDLDLSQTSVSDISALASLTQLKRLYLRRTTVSDVSPLTALKALTYLGLDGTAVLDVSPLAGLTQLEDLYLGSTAVSDVSTLSALKQLQWLNLSSTTVSDVSTLSAFKQLQWLNLSSTTVSDVSALSGLAQLEFLYLWGTPVSDVSTLAKLTQLKRLGLGRSSVSDVSPLAALTQLKHLDFERTAVSDVSVLAKLTQLESLDIERTAVSDVSALAALTKLEWFSLERTSVSDVSPLNNLTSLKILRLQGTPLSYPSIHTHIPAMRKRGVKVHFNGKAQPAFLKISGDRQENTVGSFLAKPLVVKAINAQGKPMKDLTVTFTVTQGKETFSTTTAKTGTNGSAQTTLSLGETLGKYTITVTAQQIPSFARFTAQATPTEIDPTDLSPIVQVGAAALPPMYWINTTSRKLYRTTAGSVKNIVPNVQNATSIAVDIAGHKVYWIEKTGERNGRIQRANFNGSNVELVKNLTSVPRDLAVDSAGRKLYLTNSWGKIQRLNLNGSGFQPDFIIDLTAPQHLALDVAGGKVYWTEPDSIWRANLNGKNKEKLIADLGEMGSIAVAGGKVYWTEKNKPDENRGTIRRAALDGSNVQTLATLLSVPIGITVDTVSRHLYLTNSNGRIQRANLAGKNIQNLVTELGMPAEIALGNTPNGAGLAAAPAAVPVFPDTTVLLANYPNPFNPETWIPYQLATPAEVTLTIYAVNGAVVRTLHLGYQPAGTYDSRSRAVYWDGRNEIGERVASGVYFYTLSTADFMATRKMLIRK